MRGRLRSLARVLASILLLGACGEPADEQAPAQTPEVLTLGAAKLMATNKPDEVLVLAADGTVSVAGEVLFKISADGTFSSPDGKQVGEVGSDNVVKVKGIPIGVTLLDDGATLTMPEGKPATLRFAANGVLSMDPKPAQPRPTTSEGCTGAVTKTCALVAVLVLVYGQSSSGG